MCTLRKHNDNMHIIMSMMRDYLMMFAALFNAVCLYNAYLSLPLTFQNVFCFHVLSWGLCKIDCLLKNFFCIMYSAFNQLVILISYPHLFVL